MKLNPLKKTEHISKRYKNYILSSFSFGKDYLQDVFNEEMTQEDLIKGPYVALQTPFKRGSSINGLVDAGILCKSFKKLNMTEKEFSRPLYSHQESAIGIIGSGRSAVITTGTGSGKTECFLYPILDEILREIEQGNREVGIRALFLYPMNALVNDQFERIRSLIKGCPDIKYGFFTGDTPEYKKERARIEQELGEKLPENELVTREEIRNNPPHILFTNYSMLEHLLIRPNEYNIFKAERLKNWKFVVLDEAHTYNGAKVIEISMLMRRLTACADRKPAFILTSATLGEKGESEGRILDFARGLTSVEFDKNDIIFADRIPFDGSYATACLPEDLYKHLNESFPDEEKVRFVCRDYGFADSLDSREIIYELLLRDRNTAKLYDLLKHSCRSFYDITDAFGGTISEEGLSNLIDLVNIAEKDGKGLFELRYHSFARPLAGGFVSFGEIPKLSLRRVREIDGMQAFEIGNCRYCHAPYIIGRIEKNGDCEYLVQNDNVDIYDIYEKENENVRLDFFLLSPPPSSDDDDDDGIVSIDKNELLCEYMLCPKCGEIHDKNNIAAVSCSCSCERKSVYRVLRKGDENGKSRFVSGSDESLNNISKCPSCGHRSVRGVVKNLTMGKDESTAIIAQLLYESIDIGDDVPTKAVSKPIGRFGKPVGPEKRESKVKQFIAFSDSRQKAGFAAVFFDSVQKRMLRKRIIWKVIEDCNYRDIPVDVLIAKTHQIITENGLFAEKNDRSDPRAGKEAWITVLKDLMKIDGDFDGEGCGLYYFDLNLDDALDSIDDSQAGEIFKDLGVRNLTRKELETLIQVAFEIFKTSPAIDYSDSGIVEGSDEARDNFEFRAYTHPICYKLGSGMADKTAKSFFHVKGAVNKITRYVMNALDIKDVSDAEEILSVLFKEIGIPYLFEGNGSYKIKASRYVLKNYRTNKYYRCSKCRRFTPYNLRGTCVHDRCGGRLEECDPDLELKNNFYRNQFVHEKIESIVIQEHTAQINRKHGREYQNDFRNKKINILSCSTTFEMGVDIGNLETVFMRNMPPTPANYVQRAGRAGRRKESSAYILTFCENKPHDYAYFDNPADMISGVIRPPHFDVINFKIIERHLIAACLGFFFRTHTDYFKDIMSFVLRGGIKAFYDYIKSSPSDLNAYINKIIPEDRYAVYRDFKWLDINNGMKDKVERFQKEIQEQINEYSKLKAAAVKEGLFKDADTYGRYIEHIQTGKVIDFLSDACVIPKYGFPVDVVTLEVSPKERGRSFSLDGLNLQRDLRIAISEYAPGSEVVADKKKYTSRYITIRKGQEHIKNYFCKCHKCQKINIYTGARLESCSYCGTELNSKKNEYFIEPIYGFGAGETKTSVVRKPAKTYAGSVSYIGDGEKPEIFLDLQPAMKIESSSNDKLLVMNTRKFFMCPKCGYSGELKSNEEVKVEHSTFYGHKCPNGMRTDKDGNPRVPKFEYPRLGHCFRTDVARFIIPSLSASVSMSYESALSFMYAFLEGISESMNIERGDIDGIVELGSSGDSWDILIYDDVPGGAGHVKRLMNRNAVISSLKAALLTVSKACCDESLSCYRCLRNYKNQSFHKKLARGLAQNVIGNLLKDTERL